MTKESTTRKRRSEDSPMSSTSRVKKWAHPGSVAARALVALEDSSKSGSDDDDSYPEKSQCLYVADEEFETKLNGNSVERDAVKSKTGVANDNIVQNRDVAASENDSKIDVSRPKAKASDDPVSKNFNSAENRRREASTTSDLEGDGKNEGQSGRLVQPIDSKVTVPRELQQEDTSTDQETSGDECLHFLTSKYNNILGWFLSTPFDSQNMLSVHRSKRRNTMPKFLEQQSSHSPCQATLPILSQRQFFCQLKESRKKKQEVGNRNKESLSISTDVSTFLLEEGKRLVESPISSEQTSRQPSPDVESERTMELNFGAVGQRKTIQPNKLNNDLAVSTVHHGTHGRYQNTNYNRPQQSQSRQDSFYSKSASNVYTYHAAYGIQNMQSKNRVGGNNHFQCENKQRYTHYTQYQKGQPASSNFQQLKNLQPVPYTAPASNSNFYQNRSPQFQNPRKYQIDGHSWNLQRNCAHRGSTELQNDMRLQQTPSSKRYQQTNNSKRSPKTVTASGKINLANSTADSIAKLPVGFGFWLENDDSSKNMAEAAAEKWIGNGRNAATSKNCLTARNVEISGVVAGIDLPEGWITKTFQRVAGATAGRKDTYFYSPMSKIKFRSMKSARIFLNILNEAGVDGNETEAHKLFNARGHKH